jgi:hypothetical protein
LSDCSSSRSRSPFELPLAFARAAVSKTRWVEAACFWPAEIRIVWRTCRKHAKATRAEVAEQLRLGYEHLEPTNAELLEMTRPPGTDDLSG